MVRPDGINAPSDWPDEPWSVNEMVSAGKPAPP